MTCTVASPCVLACSEAEPSEGGQNLGYVDPVQKETQYSATEVRIKQSAHHEPEGYSRDVRSAFSGLPKVKPQWRDNYMKMMIVGECGQGQPFQCRNNVMITLQYGNDHSAYSCAKHSALVQKALGRLAQYCLAVIWKGIDDTDLVVQAKPPSSRTCLPHTLRIQT